MPTSVLVMVEGRPTDDEEVVTAVTAPALGEGTVGDRALGARGIARGRRSMILFGL